MSWGAVSGGRLSYPPRIALAISGRGLGVDATAITAKNESAKFPYYNACIVDVDLLPYIDIQYARVTVGSQVLSLSHKPKPVVLFPTPPPKPMQILCTVACIITIKSMAVLSIVTHISTNSNTAQRSKRGRRPHLAEHNEYTILIIRIYNYESFDHHVSAYTIRH